MLVSLLTARDDAPPRRYKLEQEELQLQEEVSSRIRISDTGRCLRALIVFGVCSCVRPRLSTRVRSSSWSRSKRSRWWFGRISNVVVLTLLQARLAADEERFWQEQLVTLLQAANARDEELCLLQQVNAAIVTSNIAVTIAVTIVYRPRLPLLISRCCGAATC